MTIDAGHTTTIQGTGGSTAAELATAAMATVGAGSFANALASDTVSQIQISMASGGNLALMFASASITTMPFNATAVTVTVQPITANVVSLSSGGSGGTTSGASGLGSTTFVGVLVSVMAAVVMV